MIRGMKKIEKADMTRILLSAVFVFLVFIPLGRMFIEIDSFSFFTVVQSVSFLSAVKHSITSAIIATCIAVVLAYILAVCIERTEIKWKAVFRIIFVLPMLIPSISHGMGLVMLFGNNGILTKLLGQETIIYGLTGIVIGSVLYAFPVAYLMISDIMQYEDGAAYEAAMVLGIPKWRQFFSITLPYLRKPMISVLFSTFTLVITDYGVPLMVGGKYLTIPVIMYQEVIGQLDFGKGSVYGSFLLIPAVVAFVIDLVNKESKSTSFITKEVNKAKGNVQKAFAYVVCVITSVMIALPITAFIILAFVKKYPYDLTFTLQNILKTLDLRADQYLFNSIIIAFAVSVIGVVISFMTAYMSSRMKSKASRFLHLSAITSAAIPGIVLGLSYVLTFKQSPFYGTIAILIMVNMVHFIASPYLMAYNSLSKINGNMEAVGHTLGISRKYMIKDIFVPICKSTLLEMFSYFFVNCMMTISAVSFLSTTANKPVALMINQFEAQMQLECAAVVSLAILAMNIFIKMIVHFQKMY